MVPVSAAAGGFRRSAAVAAAAAGPAAARPWAGRSATGLAAAGPPASAWPSLSARPCAPARPARPAAGAGWLVACVVGGGAPAWAASARRSRASGRRGEQQQQEQRGQTGEGHALMRANRNGPRSSAARRLRAKRSARRPPRPGTSPRRPPRPRAASASASKPGHAQPGLAGDQPHAQLGGGLAQFRQPRDTRAPAPRRRVRHRRWPDEVGEQRAAALVGGEQHHRPAERGGAGGEHEGVMRPLMRRPRSAGTRAVQWHRQRRRWATGRSRARSRIGAR